MTNPPARNVNCRHYQSCLTDAAIRDDKALHCPGCQYEHDQTGRRLDRADLPGILCLLAMVFSPNGDKLDIRETNERIEANLMDIIARLSGTYARPWEYEYRVRL